ncbi:MAG: Membrane transport protein [Clostridiales bacterium]|jgi:predicted permease|nr:Membrane transport protein [Clostridiales bacterium]
MELAIIASEKIINMFFILILGVFLYKIKILTKEVLNKLSTLLLMVIAPILIITSFQIEFDSKMLLELFQAFAVALFSFLFIIILAHFLIRKTEKRDYLIERMSIVYSNCGFIGIPLIYGLFGKIGIFYMTGFFTIFNLLFWTHGIVCISGKTTRKETVKRLCNPSIIAVIIGFFVFGLRITIPGLLLEPMNMIANINTPLAMLLAGATLAQGNFFKSILKIRMYYLSFLKLILVPLLFLLVLIPLKLNQTLAMTELVAVACPAAASSTLLAIKYEKDSAYAAEIFAVTTVLSSITLPLIVLIGMMFL